LIQDVPGSFGGAGGIAVPNLIGPGMVKKQFFTRRTVNKPLFTSREPMVFRAIGEKSTGHEVRLMVTTDASIQSSVVAPDTVKDLAHGIGVRIEARRLTKLERARSFGKVEVVLALIAVLLAAAAIVTTIVTPSADQNVGRADLAVQLQPIEQRLAIGISTRNATTVQQAQAQLRTALEAEDHASNDVSTGAMAATLVLGLLSAIIALGVAAKRAIITPP
jgi:hypothetical protein